MQAASAGLHDVWRVYYDDGTTSDDVVTQPYRVVCIVQPREKTGREVVKAYPYYICKANHWRGVEDAASLIQQLIYFAPEIDLVVMGIWTDEDNYNAIIRRATEEPGLPRRSAADPDYRR